MDSRQAIEKIKEKVSKCKYSTMKRVFYVALQCENGIRVKMENCNTVWQWWVTETQTKLVEILHK